MKKNLGCLVFQVNHPEITQSMIKNPERFAFTSQMSYLINYHHFLRNQMGDLILVDSLYSLKHVYQEYLLKRKWISEAENQVFLMAEQDLIAQPDIIIYFYGTFDNTYQRMKDNGNRFSLDEFKDLHYHFEWTYDLNNCQIPIYKVNVDDSLPNIVRNVKAILDKISQRAI